MNRTDLEKRPWLIVFTSFYFAKKSEEVLTQESFTGEVLSTPPSLHNMCGLCILVAAEEGPTFLQALADHHITHSGVYYYEGPHGTKERIQLQNS